MINSLFNGLFGRPTATIFEAGLTASKSVVHDCAAKSLPSGSLEVSEQPPMILKVAADSRTILAISTLFIVVLPCARELFAYFF